MHAQRDIRIRLLGSLEVVRPDETLVAVEEWRTGKTMDLLRLLALSNGRPVRPTSLIEKLWPKASPTRGRGSLRTATSQIRRAVGTNCVVRQPEGLVLRGTWVDVDQFVEASHGALVAARDGDHTRVLTLAREAELLYAGDFRAYDDDADWAIAEREYLARLRVDLLCDAAVSAQALRRFREAADLASAAIRIDGSSETAHRTLMSAQAELGEVASALRIFESYRVRLAEELGVDPSPQTRELHLRLLRGNTA